MELSALDMLVLATLVTLLALPTSWGAHKQHYKVIFPIVGLFHPEQAEQERTFKLAVEKVNLDNTIYANMDLLPVVEYFSHFDSFNTSKRVCTLISEGIAGIFGPQSFGTTGVVQSICDQTEIPHIDMRWDTSARHSASEATMNINLYPETKLLAKAIIGIIEVMDWQSYTIVYENEEGLLRLQEVLKPIPENVSERHIPFSVRQLPDDEDYRPLLKEIKKSGESHIVLECATNKILQILDQSMQVGLMGEYTSFILTSLDSHTLDFSDYKHDRTNITALRIVDPASQYVLDVLEDWKRLERARGRHLDLRGNELKTESALMYDAVTLYAKALHSISGQPKVKPVECSVGEKWKYGFELINYMKMLTEEGMTGGIKFDKYGRRNYFRLEIIELGKEGFKKIGTWDSIHGVNYTRTQREMTDAISESITNKKFIVTSRLGRPYLEKVEREGLEGNAQFEGYSMDLIDAISKDLGFKYEFKIVKGNEYGSLNKETKQWSGLIREIQDRRADLAICDLTITHDRRTAVDFTMPFMTLGISILYSKQPKPAVNLFSFMSPLSVDVWIYMATAYLGISLLLFFLSRCSPGEWSNPHPCNPDPDELELTFNLPNCLWFSIGSLTTQGCDLLPKAVSTRVVAGMWWFFILIMISSYTANLAAFLTQQKMGPSIENVEQLGAQSKIKYGVMLGGSTYNFFKTSNDSLYKKMWSVMESAQPSVFVASNDEGVDRVRKSKNNYAFFMESTTIEFQMEQYCDLTQIGNLLDSKGYGIAMPPNSPYRTAISGSVLKLQESGKLLEIKKKWWSASKNNNTSCDDYGKSDQPSNELGMSDVGGVFVVLIAGCVFSFFVAILEFLWNVRKVAVEEKITPMEAMMAELRFVFQCIATTKPVKLASSPGPSLRGSFLQLNIFDRLNSKERSVPRTQPVPPGWIPQ